jgi:hypothetical protein
VRVVQSSGEAAASSRAVLARATATGRFITPRASRYQPSEVSETAGPRRIERASMRGPSRASSEGTTRIAISAESSATEVPATAIE